MNVVYCFDDNYARVTVVSARSLLKWTPNAKIHLIHQGVTAETLDWMKKRLPEDTTVFYDAGDDCWATVGYKSHIAHISKATNLRLCIPEILPVDIHKVIYLDSDTLVFADLTKYVESFPIPESGFGARQGGSMSSKTWGRGIFPHKATPLVAGVLVMDLTQLRRLGFGEACHRILAQIGTANDQTLVNIWCRGNFGQLHAEMNMRADEVENIDKNKPRILHYEGAGGKPWEFHYKNGHMKNIWKFHSDLAEIPWPRKEEESSNKSPPSSSPHSSPSSTEPSSPQHPDIISLPEPSPYDNILLYPVIFPDPPPNSPANNSYSYSDDTDADDDSD